MANPFTEPGAAGTALVLCKDARTRELIIHALEPLAIHPQFCDEIFAASRLLETNKFEAVMVDLLLGEEALLIMSQLRFLRTNRTAVTFAITAAPGPSERAALDAMFVLQRPLTSESVGQTVRAAYGLIVRERRRYFRCPIAVPAFVKADHSSEFLCQTVNVSEGGIAIAARTMPDSTLPAAVRFNLPDRSSQLFAQTKVCWRGQEGLWGLEFLSLPEAQKAELQEWLARKLDETLPENVAALFRSGGQASP